MTTPAPLAPLATPDDLAAFTGRDDIPDATATLAVAIASGLVRKYTRQALSLVTGDSVDLAPTWGPLALPQRPTVAVTSVTIDGTAVTDWTLRGNQLTRCAGFPGWTTVVYDHGYDPVPDDVRGVVLDLAAQTVTNPDMLRSVGLDDYTATYAAESLGAGVLSDDHKKALGEYRRRSGSIRPTPPPRAVLPPRYLVPAPGVGDWRW